MTVFNIGNSAIDRAGNLSGGYTYIDLSTLSGYDGKINTVQLWFHSTGNAIVGAFYLDSGTTYICRDITNLGLVAAGSVITFGGLNINIEAGDHIGIYNASGANIDSDVGVSGDIAYNTGNHAIPGNSSSYAIGGSIISLYGIGHTPPFIRPGNSIANLLAVRLV
jgi:hypothetical protein